MHTNFLQMQGGINSINRESTMGQLYASNYHWLVNLLSKKLNCPQKAADLAQDTFISLMSRKLIDEIHEPRAYLTTIAQRILYNFYKRQSLEKAYLEALSHLSDELIISVENRLIFLETLQQIDSMLDGLPDNIRRAFLLSQLEGQTYSEIAVILKISHRTVKRYMSQAFEQCLLLVDRVD